MRTVWHVTTPCCGLEVNDQLLVSTAGIRVTVPRNGGAAYDWSTKAITAAQMGSNKVPAHNGGIDFTAEDNTATPGTLTCIADGIVPVSWVADEGPPPPFRPPRKPRKPKGR